MTRDVDPAGIMSLTEYDLAVRASERTKMSQDESRRLDDSVSHKLKTDVFWCQNCSKIQVEKQGAFCWVCLGVEKMGALFSVCLELLQKDDS